MYDELIKRLRDAAKISEGLAVLLPHSEGDATAKLYNEAADAIEELSKPKWIPVTERLPEDGERALVMRFDYVTNTPFYDLLWFDKGEWWNRRYTGNYAVTHWMPLPEPPKEETK